MQGTVTARLSSVKWQGYRSGADGIVVYYESDTESSLPIRMITGTRKSDHNQADPNYETGTYGMYDCLNSKLRNKFARKKFGYVFFMTRYQGTNEELTGKVILTGYYKVNATADVQKLHLRHLEDTTCFNAKACQALRADDMVFLAEDESYVLGKAALKSVGYEKKITRMSKIELDEEMVKKLLKKFEGKDNRLEDYLKEHEELSPVVDDEDDDE